MSTSLAGINDIHVIIIPTQQANTYYLIGREQFENGIYTSLISNTRLFKYIETFTSQN